MCWCDLNCMVIVDSFFIDKFIFEDWFGYFFDELRVEIFDWLKIQYLGMFYYYVGQLGMGYNVVVVIFVNVGFFGLGLVLLQGIIDFMELFEDFLLEVVIYIVLFFCYIYFEGKQVVVYNCQLGKYEMFFYNFYFGLSVKKGVYGMLIGQGEEEGWVIVYCFIVWVVMFYDNVIMFMYEGVSGGGKSEMLQQFYWLLEGSLLLGKNILIGEKRMLDFFWICDLELVIDDMVFCYFKFQKNDGKFWLEDVEDVWFIRVDYIEDYGIDMVLEKIIVKLEKLFFFLNIEVVFGGRVMIWDYK